MFIKKIFFLLVVNDYFFLLLYGRIFFCLILFFLLLYGCFSVAIQNVIIYQNKLQILRKDRKIHFAVVPLLVKFRVRLEIYFEGVFYYQKAVFAEQVVFKD